MIKATIKGKVDLPSFNFQNDLKHIADRIVIPELSGHIQQGEDIRGRKYDSLSPKTIKQKVIFDGRIPLEY